MRITQGRKTIELRGRPPAGRSDFDDRLAEIQERNRQIAARVNAAADDRARNMTPEERAANRRLDEAAWRRNFNHPFRRRRF